MQRRVSIMRGASTDFAASAPFCCQERRAEESDLLLAMKRSRRGQKLSSSSSSSSKSGAGEVKATRDEQLNEQPVSPLTLSLMCLLLFLCCLPGETAGTSTATGPCHEKATPADFSPEPVRDNTSKQRNGLFPHTVDFLSHTHV